MSFITFHPPLTGYQFELKVDRLLGSLNYTVKYSNGHIPCLHTPPHSEGREPHHEFDHYVIYRIKPNNIIPRYSKERMLISCKKSIDTMTKVMIEKKALKELIECYNKNVNVHNRTAQPDEKMKKVSYGLIISGDKISRTNRPDLGDGIYFWDLSRSFFYAWRAFYSKNLGVPNIYGENLLDTKSTFIFGTVGDPEAAYNQGECEIFYDATEQLDQDTMEEYLNKIMEFVKTHRAEGPLMKKGTITVNVHTLNQFPNQVVDRKDDIAEAASNSNVDFYISSYYNHSMVPWDPLTKTMSRYFTNL